MAKKGKFETFNDGLVWICEENEAGRLVKITDGPACFGIEKTGITRHYAAKSVGEKVDKTIHIPIEIPAKTDQIAVMENEAGDQFYIKMVQEDKTARPPLAKLTLMQLSGRRKKEFADVSDNRD